MDITYKAVAKVMADYPDLLVDGFQYKLLRGGDGFDTPRQLLLTEEFRSQVQIAADYLAAHPIMDKASSVRVMDAIKATKQPGQDLYVPQGALIAAAILLGYQAKPTPNAPHCFFTREAA